MEIFPLADTNPNTNLGVRRYPNMSFRRFVRTPNLFYRYMLELKLSSESLEIFPEADR